MTLHMDKYITMQTMHTASVEIHNNADDDNRRGTQPCCYGRQTLQDTPTKHVSAGAEGRVCAQVEEPKEQVTTSHAGSWCKKHTRVASKKQ
jgi:hypothetical protein